MTEHKVGTREEWMAARKELHEKEDERARRSEELAQQRQELPWVPVEKEYAFETDDGTKTLAERFDGRGAGPRAHDPDGHERVT
jgi:predicted dithiol-disulfide oxidoreductase (DUF899 family)